MTVQLFQGERIKKNPYCRHQVRQDKYQLLSKQNGTVAHMDAQAPLLVLGDTFLIHFFLSIHFYFSNVDI